MPKIAKEVLSDKQVAVLMERAQAAVDDGWNPRMDAPVGSMSKRQPLQTTRTVTTADRHGQPAGKSRVGPAKYGIQVGKTKVQPLESHQEYCTSQIIRW